MHRVAAVEMKMVKHRDEAVARVVPLGAHSIAPHPFLSFLLSRSTTVGERKG